MIHATKNRMPRRGTIFEIFLLQPTGPSAEPAPPKPKRGDVVVIQGGVMLQVER